MSSIKPKIAAGAVKIPEIINSRRIQAKVGQLARQISTDYAPPARTPLMICVLTGAFVFISDLLRRLDIPVDCDFIRLSSYSKGTSSTGKIKVLMDLSGPVKGRDVIIVDDIIDTGLTTKFLVNHLKHSQARGVKVCALLNKPARRTSDIKIDYLGFNIPNKFVVGYGIDYREQYRQLDYIGYIPKQKQS
jgi:hypoxanthine phosphoribosyltransferase